MKLCFVNETDHQALRAWNTDDTAESLSDQGLPCESVTWRQTLNIHAFDAFVFYRTLSMNAILAMRNIKQKRPGVPVGFMIDDLLWDSRFDFAYYPMAEQTAKLFFKEADFFVFTSERLAEVAAPLIGKGKLIFIRKPAILERRFERLVSKSDMNRNPGSALFKILITKGHITKDFVRLVHGIFAHAFPSPIELHYFSHENHFSDLENDHLFVRQWMERSFDDYLDSIAQISPDLILAPFSQSDFNDCKCYPKYLEAGAIAAPLLVSSIAPYRSVITDAKNGLIASSHEGMIQKLIWAMTHRSELHRIGISGRYDVRQRHLLGPHARKLYSEIRAIIPANNGVSGR